MNGDAGLEKNENINIFYSDQIGKRELLNDLILNTCLPKEWGQGDEPKVIEEGQEL